MGEPDCTCDCGHINDDHDYDGKCYGHVGITRIFGGEYPEIPFDAIACDCRDNNDNGRRTKIYSGVGISNESHRCENSHCNSGKTTSKYISATHWGRDESNSIHFFICTSCLKELAIQFLRLAEPASPS